MSSCEFEKSSEHPDINIEALLRDIQTEVDQKEKNDEKDLQYELLIEAVVPSTLAILAENVEDVGAYRALLNSQAQERGTVTDADSSAFDAWVRMITEYINPEFTDSIARAAKPNANPYELLLDSLLDTAGAEQATNAKVSIAQETTEVFGYDISLPLRATMDRLSSDDIIVSKMTEDTLMHLPISTEAECFAAETSSYLHAQALCGEYAVAALVNTVGTHDEIEEHARTLVAIALQRVQGKNYFAVPVNPYRADKAKDLQSAYAGKLSLLKSVVQDICKKLVYEAPNMVTEAEILWPDIHLEPNSN